MRELPTGTVAFLFTDIEGSTRRWEQGRAAMGGALARHDALLRSAIEEHGGRVFKTVGDAFCAVFSGAPDAAAAAVASQRALVAEVWGEAGPLRARMALHAGRAEERDGDYFGPPLNRVARLLAAGHGGQVLLSLAAAELTRDELPERAELRDLGEHRLKDLSRPERVFQLLHPELPATFPPLRTLDRRPHNLPVQPTPLVGREEEVARLVALLRRADARLVTLTGPGGVGKTRLALHVAAELADAIPDGSWFVDLAALAEPALVPTMIAAALSIREEGDRPLFVTLRDHLQDKRLLLVLDNFEHLLGAAPLVGELLAACPGLTVLATSRAPLRLRAEWEVPVAPLALPDRAHLPPPAQLTQYAAVRLFVERAVVARSDFAVTKATAPVVVELCRRLDGLPLAIELAAAGVKLLSPEALLARLEQRLPMVTDGAQDLPARQRTLHDTVAWSYDHLAPAEQTLFRRLAVFAGGFTAEAAEAIAARPEAGARPVEAAADLAALVDKSLIWLVEAVEGGSRYGMLETIRKYALERLEGTEAEAAREAHAAYFADLAEQAVPALNGPEAAHWLRRLEVEHDNLQGALTWAVQNDSGAEGSPTAEVTARERQEGFRRPRLLNRAPIHGDSELLQALREHDHLLRQAAGMRNSFARSQLEREAELLLMRAEQRQRGRSGAAIRLGLALIGFWMARGHISEGWRYLDHILARSPGLSLLTRGEILLGAGHMAHARADMARAAAFYKESAAIWNKVGERLGLARALTGLGCVASDQGDYDGAADLHHQALQILRAQGYRNGIATAANNLGVVEFRRGNHARAAAWFDEALAAHRASGDERGVALLLNNLGAVAEHQGDLALAAELYGQGLARWRELGVRPSMALALQNLSDVALAQGDQSRAAMLCHEALTLRRMIEDSLGIAETLETAARVALAGHRSPQAARILGAAAALREQLGAPVPLPDQAALQRAAGDARTALGEAAFAAEWEAGRALPVERAADEALVVVAGLGGAPGADDEGRPRSPRRRALGRATRRLRAP